MTVADPRPRPPSPRERVRAILARRIADPMELHETVEEIDQALELPTTVSSARRSHYPSGTP